MGGYGSKDRDFWTLRYDADQLEGLNPLLSGPSLLHLQNKGV